MNGTDATLAPADSRSPSTAVLDGVDHKDIASDRLGFPPADHALHSVEWDEAYRRLCLYLRAHGLRGDRRIARLANRVLNGVDRNDPKWKGMHPLAIAMAAINDAAVAWFGNLGENVELEEGGAKEINGKLAMLVLQDSVEWSDHFLSPTLPEDTRALMRAKMVMRGPNFSLASMSPRPMDYGPLSVLAMESQSGWDWWPVTKAVVFWFCIYCLMFFILRGSL